MAFGLAIGVTPLWGFHFFLVLAVCWPLRLDVPLSYLAANISIPLIAPFLTMAELEIGSFLLTGASLPMSLALVKAKGAGLFVREIAVGTLVFSPVVASFGGALTYAAVRLARRGEQRAPRPVLDLAFDRVAARYAAGKKRAAYYYVRGKLAGDPVARVIADLAAKEPLGTVIDAGSGRGQLSLLLLEQNLATRVTGFDWDEGKVAIATRASLGLPASFRTGDLTSPLGEEADTGMLIDVLHYLTDAEQEAALTNVARAARRTVLVRELDPDRGWRSTVTRIQEWVTTGLRYNRGKRVRVRPIRELSSVLEREGFKVDVQPCWGGTPFANVLLVARRVRIE